MRASTLLFVLVAPMSGCTLDPTFFGYWDIVSAERGGATQTDVGFFEVGDDGSIAVFVRYQPSGAAFVPDPTPEVVFGDTDQTESDTIEYAEDGEVHTIWFSPFDAVFRVEEYYADEAVLTHPEALWPGDPSLSRAATTLEIRR
jgi:hypothetical protein